MKKILVAMESSALSEYLQDQLSPYFPVILCQNGEAAAELLRELTPQLLVVDLQLPGMDGITLVRLARDCGLQCRVIALSAFISDYIATALEQLQVDCLMRCGCDVHFLINRMIELLDAPVCPWEICRLLTLLGLPVNSAGFRYTQCAISLYLQNPGIPITAGLYPAVALQCGATPTQVEKAIRCCIEAAWKAGDPRLWRMYFPCNRSGMAKKPVNRVFIATIAGYVCPHTGETQQKIV